MVSDRGYELAETELRISFDDFKYKYSDLGDGSIEYHFLTLANDLHDLSSSQAQIPRNRIHNLDSGQLRVLQPVSI